MKERVKAGVYLETTVLSYLAAEESRIPAVAIRQNITRRWWEQEREKHDLFVSEAVENECRRGDARQARRRLAFIEQASMLVLNESIMELAEKLVIPGGLPERAAVDAVHIAAASVYGIDYLMTWNIRHIANAQIRRVAERIIKENGYERPIVCTPEELFGVDTLGRR